jgi:hypothetical protein
MAHKEFLKNLFDLHMADLDSVMLEGNTFICPICFAQFSEEGVDNGDLTDGHVWPDYIREKSRSKVALLQRVILCKSCNNTAGSRGDKQMQLREKIKDGERAGQLYDEREIQIITIPDKKPIKLRAKINIRKRDTFEGQIIFPVDKRTGQWLRNNPMEQERFLTATQNDEFSMIIEPPHELKSVLPPVGWITSAYLLAFYTFGYRYILHPGLDIVRDYILKSFDEKTSVNLEIPKYDNFGLTECKMHNFEDTEIALIIPADENTRIHLRISFLDYHVRLPFHFVPHILQAIILSVPDIANRFPEMRGTEAILYSPIVCKKSDGHDCIWDYVLGKPLPNKDSPTSG